MHHHLLCAVRKHTVDFVAMIELAMLDKLAK
jgi:hypothetical protein